MENSRNLQTKFLASCLLKDQESQQVFESLITPKFEVGNNTNPVSKSEPSGPLFSKVHQEFLEFKIKEGLSECLQNEYARFYEIWCLLVEDKPIETYKASDIGRFIDRCYQLPRKNRAPYSKMSFKECLDYDVPPEDCVQPKTFKVTTNGYRAYSPMPRETLLSIFNTRLVQSNVNLNNVYVVLSIVQSLISLKRSLCKQKVHGKSGRSY